MVNKGANLQNQLRRQSKSRSGVKMDSLCTVVAVQVFNMSFCASQEVYTLFSKETLMATEAALKRRKRPQEEVKEGEESLIAHVAWNQSERTSEAA